MRKRMLKAIVGLLAVIALLFLAELSFMDYGYPEHETFNAPAPSATSWDQVFSEAGPISVTTFETGRINVPVSGVLNLDYPSTRSLPKSDFMVPVFSHWIHHPIYGDYLVDTGFDASFAKGACGNIDGLLVGLVFGPCTQNPGQDIATQLASHQVTLKGVFFTHLHPDHTAGVPGLPATISFVAGPHDNYDNYPVLLYRDHLSHIRSMYEFDFSSAPVMAPLGPCIDVFGDASLWAIFTPGHTRGHVSYLVNSDQGPVLLTGDASHTRWGFEHDVPPGWSVDDKMAKSSLDQLIAFKQKYPQITVIYGHEYANRPLLISQAPLR